MVKTDDPMYDCPRGGWMYVKYARMAADSEYAMVGGGQYRMQAQDVYGKATQTAYKLIVSSSYSPPDVMTDDDADDTDADDMDDTMG